jgi:NADH-quinone oxidoreductase subunit M
VFWEVMLLPMYFLIGIWGGPRKEYAAIKFFLYTLAGSVLMLIAMIAMYYASTAKGVPFQLADGQAVEHTFNLMSLAYNNTFSTASVLGVAFGKLMWVFLFIGFAIKVPMFPFHTWLPDAHVEAPTPISVILAGVLLKMGTYGMFRFNFAIFPGETQYFATTMAVFGMINIVYGALVAMAQKDLKKLVAYSSISHMGFCLLGMAGLTATGAAGAMFQMFNHGTITAMLFLLVGVIYDRAHHRQVDGFGGLAKVMPIYTALVGLAFMAALGLPGLSGFISEALCFLGAFPVFKVLTIISTLGIVVNAAYFLWAIQRMFLGPTNEKYKSLPEITAWEATPLVALGAIVIVLGFYPAPVLDVIKGSLTDLVAFVSQAAPAGIAAAGL